MAIRKKRGIIVGVNKWDLIEKDEKTILRFEENLKAKLAPFNDVPILFVSVLEKQRIFKLVEAIDTVSQNMSNKIPGARLNEIMLKEIGRYHPPAVSGKLVSIKYVSQLPSRTPTFAFFANHPKYIGESYKHFLENQLRKHFPLKGVPISIVFREK
jgi:GTP-binding protein